MNYAETIEIPIPLEKAHDLSIEALKLLGHPTMKRQVQDGYRITAKTGMNLWTFGEIVSIQISKLSADTVKVEISSKPRLFCTLLDWGMNRKNVEKIVDFISTQTNQAGEKNSDSNLETENIRPRVDLGPTLLLIPIVFSLLIFIWGSGIEVCTEPCVVSKSYLLLLLLMLAPMPITGLVAAFEFHLNYQETNRLPKIFKTLGIFILFCIVHIMAYLVYMYQRKKLGLKSYLPYAVVV